MYSPHYLKKKKKNKKRIGGGGEEGTTLILFIQYKYIQILPLPMNPIAITYGCVKTKRITNQSYQ